MYIVIASVGSPWLASAGSDRALPTKVNSWAHQPKQSHEPIAAPHCGMMPINRKMPPARAVNSTVWPVVSKESIRSCTADWRKHGLWTKGGRRRRLRHIVPCQVSGYRNSNRHHRRLAARASHRHRRIFRLHHRRPVPTRRRHSLAPLSTCTIRRGRRHHRLPVWTAHPCSIPGTRIARYWHHRLPSPVVASSLPAPT